MPKLNMHRHRDLSDREVFRLIWKGAIVWGGNRRLKIFGHLHCSAGKRMKRENRVFFGSEQEAREAGYRPCARCMPHAYKVWKTGSEK